MILAAGLTPAWQQILLFDSFQPGAVNRAREAHWCASGKVLNAGIALYRLGAECKTLALVGGQTGEATRQEFAQTGIDARWIPSATTTRVCTTIIDRSRGVITELIENSPPVDASELAAFADAYAEEAAAADVVILTGSLPLGAPATFYRDLLARTRCLVILDARGPELLATLDIRRHDGSRHVPRDDPRHAGPIGHDAFPFLIKPNREELARTVGREIHDDTDLLAAMRELHHRGAQWVVVTQGKEAAWVTSATETYRLQPPPATVVNPIGCGDCLAAGIAWGLQEQLRANPSFQEPNDVRAALRLGLSAAADNLSQLLPARLDRESVLAISRGISIEEIVVG